MKKKSIVMLATGIILTASLVIGGTLAYFTDSKDVTNTFTVGAGVTIKVDEENVDPKTWVPTGERTDGGVKYDNIYPNAILPKDPTITNTGNDPIYARMRVTITNASVWDSATGNNPASMLDIQSGWAPDTTKTTRDDVNDTITYVYNYNTAIAKDEKATLFTKVTIPNLNNAQMAQLGTDFDIVIIGDAIQANGFTDAAEAFAEIDQALADNAPNT